MDKKKKDHVAGLAIQIPDEMLRAVILAEVAKALPEREVLVASIVKEAMSEPSDNYRARQRGQTKFGELIKAEVRETCQRVFRAWLEDHKDLIEKEMMASLKRHRDKKIKALVEVWTDSLVSVRPKMVSLRIDDGEF